MATISLVCFSFLSVLLGIATADEHSHVYDDGEEVVLWTNTVGPYHNRQETYRYYSLPFCRGTKKGIAHYHETLGEALQGVELEFSGLDINFKTGVPQKDACEITLSKADFVAFQYAAQNNYWYQMYIDDLPIWGVVGELDDQDNVYILTHKKIRIGFSDNQIVEVNLSCENKVKLEENAVIKFTYEVEWYMSTTRFAQRFDRYLDSNFFQHRIHWFSIFNSFMMVIFLVGLVAIILMRTLKKDYARYTRNDEVDEIERDDEYGWKQVHGDVFRPSTYPILFSSFVGTGAHIFAVSIIVILMSLLSKMYLERGSFLSTTIFVFAACSPINGFVGGSLYSQMGGRRWIRQMIIGTFLLPTIICGSAFLINFIAIGYRASRAISFFTMVIIVCICVFVVLPLNLVGTLFGRRVAGQPDYPCRINTAPRPIPVKKWYMEPAVIILSGGILPFGSIFIEMYFIFTSFWAYKIYYVFGFTLLVFFILFIVSSCVTTVATYFLLNAEDYRWQWTSFLSGSSTAVYVYLYSIYYFFFKTKMYGLFQTIFYFGYMGLFCVVLGIMCGSVGYFGSSRFVKKIYSTIKID